MTHNRTHTPTSARTLHGQDTPPRKAAAVPERTPLTLTDRVGLRLLASSQWINALDLMRVGGAMAWRTRLSEARRRYGFQTENRVRHITRGGRRVTVSEYRRVA